MPKIELHAHLNGCVRESTLRNLATSKNISLSPRLHHHHHHHHDRRSLSDCFEIFTEIHRCVDDIASLKRVTREALWDFERENVVYLELRSTPRRLTDCEDKKGYVDAVLEVMEDFDKGGGGEGRKVLIPRFLLSIDRAGDVEDAVETAVLAVDYFRGGNKYVVGVDVGGNPTKNDLRDFIPALQLVRDAGMKVSVHCGEVPQSRDSCDEETEAILQFRPDRIGHALFLPPSAFQSPLVQNERAIPVECCPTSNTMTIELSTTKRYNDILEGLCKHPHLKKWLETNYPVTISTDDPGVFGTDATREHLLLARAFHLDWKDIGNLVVKSCRFVFERRGGFHLHLEKRVNEEMDNLGSVLFTQT